jgi:hypothetical protein
MDITICVMLPTRGSSDFTEAGNANYPMLGVVCLYPYLIPDEVVIGAPRTGYVGVTGVPDDKYERIKEVLTRDDVGFKRVWAGVASRLSTNVRNRLAADRRITVTWTQFKNFIQNIKEQRDFSDADVA